MTFKRGDIVLATLPFTDLTGSRIRPALVVQCDRNNQRLDDVILVMITRTLHRATTEPTQLLIDLASADGAATGLLHTSVVKCEHIITLHGSLLTRVIGTMPATLMQQVDACLKASLQLK
jgi:mRNA interferase MazF